MANVGIYQLTDTWNNGATTFNGIKLDVTDTASAADSKLLDLQVGGASKFSVKANSDISVGSFSLISQQSGGVAIIGGSSGINFQAAGVRLGGIVAFGPSVFSPNAFLTADAANTLTQRNGTSAQTFNLYNTYTDASNYERGFISWNDTANTFVIGTEVGGTGTARDLEFSSATGSIRAYNAAHTQQRFLLNHNANTPSIKLSQSTGKTATYTPIWLAASDDYTISSTAGNLIGINPGVSITQGTLTDDKQAIDITSTWSDVADTFTLIKADVTDTASAAGSLLMDLQVASSGVFQVSKAGGPGFYGSAPVAQAAHIADPTGGATTDAEARTAINAILVALENIGITAAA